MKTETCSQFINVINKICLPLSVIGCFFVKLFYTGVKNYIFKIILADKC